jgi:cysteine synthase B
MLTLTRLRDSPLEARVGNTPLLDLSHLVGNRNVRLFAKAEWHNPGGSIKDRPALRIVRDAIADRRLSPGTTLLDATSGNMGISYAWLGAAKGFKVKLCLSAGASEERKQTLRALGAQLEFTDPAESSDGAIRRAQELAHEEPDRFFYANQYDNPSNPLAHEETTGPEIWAQTQGRVTHFIAGLGTTGTLVGVSRYLRRVAPGAQIVGIQPNSPLHGLEGLKHLPTAIRPGVYDRRAADQIVDIDTEAAYESCRRLAQKDGLMVGISAGAAIAASLAVAGTIDRGVIVTVLPDSGQRYLSSAFWTATDGRRSVQDPTRNVHG